MKVLLVDTKTTGHHIPYAKSLEEHIEYEAIYFLPNIVSDIKNKQIIMKNKPESILGYLRWIYEIYKVAKTEGVNVIHFLYGDILYRYFGIGLGILKKFKVIVTFHQIRRSKLRDLSRKLIFNKIDYGVVHTQSLKTTLINENINNVKQIEYPQLVNIPKVNQKDAQKFFGIEDETIVIGSIGGTRYDKGLDLLLEALKLVDREFKLLIAGRAESFSEQFIKDKTVTYKNKVISYIKFLNEDELSLSLNAVDIIVLPYRYIFDGASGPLSEGIWLRKAIIGPNHGSLGEIIRTNNLGLTFESENINDLATIITTMIDNRYVWNEVSEEYRKKISVENFRSKYHKLYLNL